jgi:gliding motility-associated protein GldM
MEQTTGNFLSKVEENYVKFEKAEEAEPAKVKEYNDKAKLVRKEANALVAYLEQTKKEMFAIADGIKIEVVGDKKLPEMSAKDNYDKPTTYFIGPMEDGKAFEMRKKIEAFKDNIVKIVNDPKFKPPAGLDTKGPFYDNDKKPHGWEHHYFYRTISAAAYTLLNKMIGEVRNIEFETVGHLFSAIDAESHKFDKVGARVIPNSRIVFSGDKYEADIIVAAFDSRQNPVGHYKMGLNEATEDMVGNLNTINGDQGVVKLSIPTSSIGDQKFAGLIELMGPDGNKQYHPFSGSYTVTKPAAAVAAEKMNVFYAGIPNPVAIAAPVAPERLRINWGGATATPLGGGRYDVTVTNAIRELTITVSADMDGRTVNMGATNFRVKTVPDPTINIGSNITGGRQPKDLLLANPIVTARMSPDFNYELRWQVLSYTVTFVRNGVEDPPISVTGPQFNDQIKQRIQQASAGTNVEFSNIRIQSIAGTRTHPTTLMVRIR